MDIDAKYSEIGISEGPGGSEGDDFGEGGGG